MDNSGKSEVADFYKNLSVFITGASGFMGKVLVEKLLYSCPDISAVYVLLRSKKGKTPNARIEDMLKLPMFDRIRKENPSAMRKLIAVSGDVGLPDLGLSQDNRQMLQEKVNVIFHVAATLRLDANLKDAIEINTSGTKKLLDFSRGLKNLKAFIHVSTAFSHCDQEVLGERTYPAPSDPMGVIQSAQFLDSGTLDIVTERLIKPHPNTYTYSKRLAEKLVYDEFQNLPVAIARPAIVTPAVYEPVPGWVDSLNGPVGLLVAGGKGVIRSMLCHPDYHAEMIPVDYAINALITIGYKVGSQDYSKRTEIPVYNLTASSKRRNTWKDILEKGKKVVFRHPFEMTIWYPDGQTRTNKFIHNLCVLFLHILPAYFIDFLMLVLGQKRFMVNIQTRIQQGLSVLQHFTNREWVFESKNFVMLWENFNETDKKLFNMDLMAMDDESYLERVILGSRQYCMKEDLSSLPRCRRILWVLWLIDRFVKLVFFSSVAYFLLTYSTSAALTLDSAFLKMKNSLLKSSA